MRVLWNNLLLKKEYFLLEEAIASGQSSSVTQSSGATSTKIVKFGNGVKAILRHQPLSNKIEFAQEYLYYYLAKKLGINNVFTPIIPLSSTAPIIVWDGRGEVEGTLQLFIKGATVGWEYIKNDPKNLRKRIANTYSGFIMGLFDTLFQQSDRHDGNWMVQRKLRRMWAIDNGASSDYTSSSYFTLAPESNLGPEILPMLNKLLVVLRNSKILFDNLGAREKYRKATKNLTDLIERSMVKSPQQESKVAVPNCQRKTSESKRQQYIRNYMYWKSLRLTGQEM